MLVTFCGHRELNPKDNVQSRLFHTVDALIREGADTFYLGGYGGFDLLATALIKVMKERYPHIQSVLVLPYLDRKIDASDYDSTVYPPLETVPKRLAIIRRNRYMVDSADVVITYVNHGWGGAAKTLRYAQS